MNPWPDWLECVEGKEFYITSEVFTSTFRCRRQDANAIMSWDLYLDSILAYARYIAVVTNQPFDSANVNIRTTITEVNMKPVL